MGAPVICNSPNANSTCRLGAGVLTGTYNSIISGNCHANSNSHSGIMAGYWNAIGNVGSVSGCENGILAGSCHRILSSVGSSIASGYHNTICSDGTFIGGGDTNTAVAGEEEALLGQEDLMLHPIKGVPLVREPTI